jgi:hypothetical protein
MTKIKCITRGCIGVSTLKNTAKIKINKVFVFTINQNLHDSAEIELVLENFSIWDTKNKSDMVASHR